MIKSQLINNISEQLQLTLSYKDVELSVNQIINRMTEALSNGERIEIRGFGSFDLHYHAPRNAHNPKTGAKVITLPKYIPHFKAGKELRDRVNASRATPIKEQDES